VVSRRQRGLQHGRDAVSRPRLHHWTSGIINGAAGLVVGEALILTQPTRTIDDLRAYRAGDLATREGTGGPSVAWGYVTRF
jgi:hypothetical protein